MRNPDVLQELVEKKTSGEKGPEAFSLRVSSAAARWQEGEEEMVTYIILEATTASLMP